MVAMVATQTIIPLTTNFIVLCDEYAIFIPLSQSSLSHMVNFVNYARDRARIQ